MSGRQTARELAYAKLNSGSQTTTSTSAADLSPALIVPTFIAPPSGVVVAAGLFAIVQHSVAGGTVVFFLTDSANTQLARCSVVEGAIAAAAMTASFVKRIAGLTPGATISGWKVRWAVVTAGTATLTHNGEPNVAEVRIESVAV
jgi:hypothetical protein